MGIEQRIANQPVLNVAVAPYQDASGQPILSLDALVRSLGVRRGAPLALFLGAGASKSSGIPSAQMCIWEWKRQIFLTNNPGLEEQFVELSLDACAAGFNDGSIARDATPRKTRRRNTAFMSSSASPFPRTGAPILPGWFAKPGHISGTVLSHLAQADFIRSVWSTNFDGLAARAAANFKLTPIEAGIDTQNGASRAAKKGELLCVSLHGDYRYDQLKNTPKSCNNKKQPYGRPLLAN